MTHEATYNASAIYTATLVDGSGNPVGGNLLDSLTLTLKDKATGQVINGRDAQDVLNKAGVTLSNLGALVWDVTPLDNTIVHVGAKVEEHEAEFVWEWAAHIGRHKFTILVRR